MSTRADVYYRMKDYDKAFSIFDEALKNGKNDMTILNNYAYYLAERDIRLKDAEKMARQVIETEKDNYTFLDTYAWVLYKRGKLKEAEKLMELIILKSEKKDAEFYEHLGYIKKEEIKIVRLQWKNWKKAIEIDTPKWNSLTRLKNVR
jgi:Tfp pilus assembly protein PilF